MQPTTLKIRLYGDPCLRKKASPIKEISSSERILIESMIKTMHEAKGIGLAAPQVGVSQRLFVIDAGTGPIALINPRIIKKHGYCEMEEGCLSIPGITVNIKRPMRVLVKYTDENNQIVERIFDDLLARVVQHENDHLNGKLIVDYAGFRERRKLKEKLKEIVEQEQQEQ